MMETLYKDNQLVRLKTANGHQVLMHDTEGIIYIGSAHGGSWVELTKDGSVYVYSAKDFAVRTQGNIELHSDRSIRMNAGQYFDVNACSSAYTRPAGPASWITSIISSR